MWKDKRKRGREEESLKGRRGRERKEARRAGRRKKREEPKEGVHRLHPEAERKEREPAFAKGAFHPLGVCVGSLYTHSNPRQKDQDSFGAFGAGG